MIETPTPFYKSSGFLKVFFSLLTAAIQNLLEMPLISTPLIARAITNAYSQYPSMHFAAATTLVALFEFLFTTFVIWSILRLVGKRTKLTILVGAVIVTSVILAKFTLR